MSRESVQLSVNLGPASTAVFRRLIASRGISITEGVRRAIAVWGFVEDEIAEGRTLLVEHPDGTRHAVVLVQDAPGQAHDG